MTFDEARHALNHWVTSPQQYKHLAGCPTLETSERFSVRYNNNNRLGKSRINDRGVDQGCVMAYVPDSPGYRPIDHRRSARYATLPLAWKDSSWYNETRKFLEPSDLSSGYYHVASLAFRYAWPSWLEPTVRLTELQATLKSFLESRAKHTGLYIRLVAAILISFLTFVHLHDHSRLFHPEVTQSTSSAQTFFFQNLQILVTPQCTPFKYSLLHPHLSP